MEKEIDQDDTWYAVISKLDLDKSYEYPIISKHLIDTPMKTWEDIKSYLNQIYKHQARITKTKNLIYKNKYIIKYTEDFDGHNGIGRGRIKVIEKHLIENNYILLV